MCGDVTKQHLIARKQILKTSQGDYFPFLICLCRNKWSQTTGVDLWRRAARYLCEEQGLDV